MDKVTLGKGQPFSNSSERRRSVIGILEGEALEVLLINGCEYIGVRWSEHCRGCCEELVEVFAFSSALMEKKEIRMSRHFNPESLYFFPKKQLINNTKCNFQMNPPPHHFPSSQILSTCLCGPL